MGDNDVWLSAVVELRAPDQSEAASPDQEVESEASPAAVPEGITLDPETAPHASGGHQHKSVPMPVAEAKVARVKQFFTSSGFEVHAPVGRTFSIGGKQAVFERFFGTPLSVQEADLGGRLVTPDSLDLDPLPQEIRVMVQAISFPPPPVLFPS